MTQQEVERLNEEYMSKSPQEVIEKALELLHPDIAFASSFGAEDVVIIDMLMKVNPEARVFTLDTGRLNQETYDVIDAVRAKYGLQVEVRFPDTAEVEDMVKRHGMNLFYKSIELRHLCCGVRKVHPLKRMLSSLKGWMTGVRRDQTPNRSGMAKFQIDEQFGGILKVNPLLDWSWQQVMDYIKEHKVPYNRLIDQGYPSIGCEPCTRAIKEGEDLRAGRWWWEQESDKECGLHADHGT